MRQMSPLRKKSLFWDTDAQTIDLVKNKRFVIERILKFGNLTDYSWLRNKYTPDEIKEVITRNRSELDRKSLNFWSSIYNISGHHALRNN
jgi:hypothetical protein